MAISSINLPSAKPKQSGLEKVALAIDIASKVLGTAVAIPKSLADRGLVKAQTAKVEEEARPLTPEEQKPFREAGVPEPAIPRTVGGIAGSLKFFETPEKKAQRIRDEVTLGLLKETAERTRRAETRTIKKEERDAEKASRDIEKEERDRTIELLGIQAPSKKNADAIEDALERYGIARKTIEKYIAMRTGKLGGGMGGTISPTKRATAASDATDLLLQFKEIAKLGILSESDEKLLDRLVPRQPLEMLQLGMATGDTILAQFENLREILNNKLAIGFRSQGIPMDEKGLDKIAKELGAFNFGQRKLIKDPPTFDPNKPFTVEGEE